MTQRRNPIPEAFVPISTRARLCLTAVTILAIPSCSKIAERAFARPVIAVRGVKVHSVGLTGGSLDVALFISNPNPYPLPVRRASYRFTLSDSTEVGRGESAAAFTLPAHDSTAVRLPVDVSWQGLRAARDASRDGTVDYRLTGTVTLDTPLGDPNVPFDIAGRFTPPPALLRSAP
jgi:LEA14-like dessication related protein